MNYSNASGLWHLHQIGRRYFFKHSAPAQDVVLPERYEVFEASGVPTIKFSHLLTEEQKKAFRREYRNEYYRVYNRTVYRQKRNEIHRNYYASHQQEIAAWDRTYRRVGMAKIRQVCIEHYGGTPPKCACCGESHIEFLTLDHIHGGGRKHRMSLPKRSTALYKWIIDNDFPNMFRILCYNCNCSQAHRSYCPHELEATLHQRSSVASGNDDPRETIPTEVAN